MNATIKAYLAEMEQEAATTRRLLERVPGDKLDWQPHPKSMTLGRLAQHVATTPQPFAKFMKTDTLDSKDMDFTTPVMESVDELLPMFEDAMRTTRDILSGWDDEKAEGTWTFIHNGEAVISAPRTAVFRQFSLNHWYHHRAQLGVYLRLLDVAVPMTYGPTADENPF
jgi:uncharacterized damage-inducible protein DinB